MIGKDKISDKPKIDAEIATEEIIIDKTLVEVMIEIEEGKTFRRNYNNNDRSRSRERSPTPRRYTNRQYNSPSTDSESRSRLNSRVTTNRDRIRYF